MESASPSDGSANVIVTSTCAPRSSLSSQAQHHILAQLQDFYEHHAFDTEGPYDDLFSVLLSTCKHLVDIGSSQLHRLEKQSVEVDRLGQETEALCDQSTCQRSHIQTLAEMLAQLQGDVQDMVLQQQDRPFSLPLPVTADASMTHVPYDDGRATVVVEKRVASLEQRLEAQQQELVGLAHRTERLECALSTITCRVEAFPPQQHEPAGSLSGTLNSKSKGIDHSAAVDVAEGTKKRQQEVATEGECISVERKLSVEHFEQTQKDIELNIDVLREELRLLQRKVQQLSPISSSEVLQRGESMLIPSPQRLPPSNFLSLEQKEEVHRLLKGFERELRDVMGNVANTLRNRVAEDKIPHTRRPTAISADADAISQSILDLVYAAGAQPGECEPGSIPALAAVHRRLKELDEQWKDVDTRLEVLEVYAPHKQAVAARPPLLGVELENTGTGKHLCDGVHGTPLAEVGIRVAKVFRGYAADRAGLSVDDVIVAVQGEEVRSRAQLYAVITQLSLQHRCMCLLHMEEAFVQQFSKRVGGCVPRAGAPTVGNAVGECSAEKAKKTALRECLPRFELHLTVRRDLELHDVLVSVPATVVLV